MGPMSGEISIAPIITAVELVLSPTDAIKMAKNSTHRLDTTKLHARAHHIVDHARILLVLA